MSTNSLLGIINYPNESRGNDYLFRVALKAVVMNKDNHILVVKETGRDWWDVPGGGIDHGESIKEGLSRELNEEVGYVGNFQYEPLEVSEPRILADRHMYQIRITFLVRPINVNFQPGEDGDEVQFVDPETFNNSDLRTEQEIYRYSQLAIERLVTLMGINEQGDTRS